MKDHLYRLAADYLLDADVKAGRERLRHRLMLVFCILCLIALLVLATKAHADPRFQVVAEGARVVLHDDKCAVAAVANLPYKATWEEKGKVFQGCWGARPDAGVVMFYFDDKSVGIIPISELTPVKAA